MPLSEEEQKILKEIEAQLNATDPALVEQVSRTTLYRHSARMIRWAALGFLGGLVLLVLTFATNVWAGVVGFLVMLGCLLVIERNVRKLGKAGMESITGGLEGRRRAPRVLRRARPRLARALPPRRHLTRRWAYTAAQAARLTGCTASQLRHWARRGLVVPSGGTDGGSRTSSATSSRCGRALAARRGPAVDPGRRRVPALRRGRATTSRACASSPTARACGRAATTARSSTRCARGQLALFVAVDRLAADVEAEVRAFDRERAAFVAQLRDPAEDSASG